MKAKSLDLTALGEGKPVAVRIGVGFGCDLRSVDVTLSRNRACACHHQRRCTAAAWCLETLTVGEVSDAVDRRPL